MPLPTLEVYFNKEQMVKETSRILIEETCRSDFDKVGYEQLRHDQNFTSIGTLSDENRLKLGYIVLQTAVFLSAIEQNPNVPLATLTVSHLSPS